MRSNLHIFLSNVESETRLYKEARYTVSEGIFATVIVVGLWASHLPRRETTDYGLDIHRLPTWLRQLSPSSPLFRIGLLRRVVAALSMIQYGLAVIRFARRQRPSHISCHNLILLPVAAVAAWASRAVLVYVPHELETERTGLGAAGKRIARWIEAAFIGRARDIVVVCDPIAQWYCDRYRLANVHVVRNVPERSAVLLRDPPGGHFRQRFAIPDNAKIFIYQGLFGPERGTDDLLDIFTRLPADQAHLVLMGYGSEADQQRIDAMVAAHSNIHWLGPVPREWIVSQTSGADIGIFIAPRVSLSYRYSLPNKFFEYVHAGLPVLVSDTLQYLTELTEAAGIGWSAPYAEVETTLRTLGTADISAQAERTATFAAAAVWENDAVAYRHIYR